MAINNNHRTKSDIEIVLGMEIPLQSGIVLKGRLYKPKHCTQRLPVVLAPTVYAADGAHDWGCHFAKNTYIFIAFEIQDLMRVRYRKSLLEETLVTPDVIEQYEFSTFRFVAQQMAKGSRLRLVICAPDILFWQKNYSSGGAVEAETGADGRLVCITLHQDAHQHHYSYSNN